MRNQYSKALRSLAALGVIGALSSLASAENATNPLWTQWGTITSIESGWVADSMSLRHSVAAMTNPANCTVLNGGYATNPADPGHNLFHTLALSAFLNKKEVAFLVHECYAGKPRIIDVAVR
jgi:hypothetical protein